MVSSDMTDRWLAEDAPYFDLTSKLLGIGDEPARISYFSRHEAILSSMEEAARLLARTGLSVTRTAIDGTRVDEGETFLCAEGAFGAVHTAWRVTLSLLEYSCGISTRTRRLVDAVKRVNPNVAVLSTRKIFPGTKHVSINAILAGGALPHRLGLSETILIFEYHLRDIGGYAGLAARIPELKNRACEKGICVEVGSREDAVLLAKAGVDALQFDKVPPEELRPIAAEIKGIDPRVRLIAAGGVNGENAVDYAASGVDAVSTTWMYFGKPADLSARIE
ncbi:MAG: ModD protein [Clostridiales Family XIII bacterium]|jgi:molybdenum transport protein|nr:ModD protein [Clostridiales Family XIII bacterium]